MPRMKRRKKLWIGLLIGVAVVVLSEYVGAVVTPEVTPAATSSDKPQGQKLWTFGFVGDTQLGGQVVSDIFARMEAAGVEFALHLGDMVDDAACDAEWDDPDALVEDEYEDELDDDDTDDVADDDLDEDDEDDADDDLDDTDVSFEGDASLDELGEEEEESLDDGRDDATRARGCRPNATCGQARRWGGAAVAGLRGGAGAAAPGIPDRVRGDDRRRAALTHLTRSSRARPSPRAGRIRA